MKEGGERVLRSFERKNQAVRFGRDYVRMHGGQLRIWSADDNTLQEERSHAGAGAESVTHEAVTTEKHRRETETVEAPDRGLFEGIARGAVDAAEAAGRLLPAVGAYLNKGIYGTSYYAAYGVVLAAVAIGRSIPMPASLARGLHEGTEAIIDSYEKGHSALPQDTAAARSGRDDCPPWLAGSTVQAGSFLHLANGNS